QDLSIVSNSPEPGLLKVAVYGAVPVAGDGVYAYLIFDLNGSNSTASEIKISGFRLNDGRDTVILKNARLSIRSRSPELDTGFLQIGHDEFGYAPMIDRLLICF